VGTAAPGHRPGAHRRPGPRPHALAGLERGNTRSDAGYGRAPASVTECSEALSR